MLLQFTKYTTIILFLNFTLVKSQSDSILVLTMEEAVKRSYEKNIKITNSELRVQQSENLNLGFIDLPGSEFTYRHGQQYDPQISSYYAINQNFGSLLTHINTQKNAKLHTQQLKDILYYQTIQNEAKTKAAFLFLQFTYAMCQLQNNKLSFYSHLLQINQLKFDVGDIDALKYKITNSKYFKQQSTYHTLVDMRMLAELELKKLIHSSLQIVPSDTTLSIYQIQRDAQKSFYPGQVATKPSHNQYNLIQNNIKYHQSKLFPEIEAGVFSQTSVHHANRFGWQISLHIPLWYFPVNRNIQQAKVESLIARNNFEHEQHEVETHIEKLLFNLNTCFRQLREFQSYLLPESDFIIHISETKLDAEEIDYETFIANIDEAFEIKFNYLTKINEYNQLAIQLETYNE